MSLLQKLSKAVCGTENLESLGDAMLDMPVEHDRRNDDDAKQEQEDVAEADEAAASEEVSEGRTPKHQTEVRREVTPGEAENDEEIKADEGQVLEDESQISLSDNGTMIDDDAETQDGSTFAEPAPKRAGVSSRTAKAVRTLEKSTKKIGYAPLFGLTSNSAHFGFAQRYNRRPLVCIPRNGNFSRKPET